MPTKSLTMRRHWREGVLVLIALALLAAILAAGPISQDPGYHQFADQRVIFGVPNFFNIVSNVLFLAFGTAGTLLCLGPRKPDSSTSWTTFFAGGILIGLGSAYYHWAPDDATLVWDRMAMAVSFMALSAALVSEHLDAVPQKIVLVSAIAIGVAAVLWWHYTGDLRFYVWVQAVPLAAVPLMLALFPGRYTHRVYLLYGFGFYFLAKLAEVADRQLFVLTSGVLSGHSLKHLLAAFGFLFVYLMLRRRGPAGTDRLTA